jgi:hypothetical protein
MRIDMNRTILQRLVVGIALVAAGVVVGAAISASNEAHGQSRGTPPPKAFQSGGQLSVPLLKEIAATLHQMDARLARLEAAAEKLQTPRSEP